MTHWVPELLAPAGSLEKLKVAVSYGADAVYLGGQKFGLRSAADNFSPTAMAEGISFAHANNSLVYVVLNSFLHDKELHDLPDFLKLLERLKVDAVIVSDLGVVQTVLDHSNLIVHLSTQASCLNSSSANFWKEIGVKRVVLGREVSIADAKMIKKVSGLEIEMFVHGSMCMAYSGNCVISNYTQGRDSNRGGCAHSCRFEYSLSETKEVVSEEELKAQRFAHFMSSKDLQGVRQLQDFIDAGIDSLKVEGRMKSHNYAGTISKVYSEALNHYSKTKSFVSEDIFRWEEELKKVSHRDYHSGNLEGPADSDSIFSDRQHGEAMANACAIVLEVGHSYILVEVKKAFNLGDTLEFVPFSGHNINVKVEDIKDVAGDSFERSRPGMLVKMPYIKGIESLNIVRSRIN
jgi:putative protease